MEEIAIVKVSELNGLFNEIKDVKNEIKEMRESEENLKAYSIQQAAKLLNLHYTTVRKLVIHKKLHAKYLNGESGTCSIPAWAIKEYLQKQTDKKQPA